MNDWLRSIILGVVEGLTEFLPVSSTGHMIITNPLIGVDPELPQWKVFLFVVQLGAILAVVVYFWRDLWRRVLDFKTPLKSHIVVKLGLAMIPTIIGGVLLNDYMEQLESDIYAVAGGLIVGAAAIELIDRRYRRDVPLTLENITLAQAAIIGLSQLLAMWPGVSRSGATIMTGMVLGLPASVAAEFSFYLAIPTMFAAGGYRLLKYHKLLDTERLGVILLGTAVAFVVALVVVAAFMQYVRRRRFTPFAVYRVVLGVAVLWAGWSGLISSADAPPAETTIAQVDGISNGAMRVQKNHATGIASSGESSTSSMPPMPGIACPESLTAASRLSSEAQRSPAVPNSAISKPKTSNPQG